MGHDRPNELNTLYVFSLVTLLSAPRFLENEKKVDGEEYDSIERCFGIC